MTLFPVECSHPRMPLILGTAQLGMRYGIANQQGKPSAEAAEAIVEAAWENGVRAFDTAQAYGDSENVLGSSFRRLGLAQEAQVISKLAPHLDPLDSGQVKSSIERSLQALGVPALHGLLLHRVDWLDLWGQGLGDALRQALSQGWVQRVGVSVYTAAEARRALRHAGVSLLQMPFNLFDQAVCREGILQEAQEKGVELHLRSIFLQGLLLLPPGSLPSRLDSARPALARLDECCEIFGISRSFAALAYASRRGCGGSLVLGAETRSQIEANCRMWRRLETLSPAFWEPFLDYVEKNLWVQDPAIINPSRWGCP